MAEMDYGQIKDKLIVELVGADRNVEMLKQVPHTMVEDMAAVYKIRLESDENHQATAMITNEFLSALGVDVQQLHQDALENAAQISPAKVLSMSAVLGLPPEMSLGGPEIIVVTTENQIKGAGALLYPDVMDQIAEKAGGDFFVLPSSVHEVLALPDYGNITSAEMQEIVMAVNGTEVEPEDQLSDHVYHFDAKEHVFELAEKFEARQEAKEQERPSVLKELADKQKNVEPPKPGRDKEAMELG